MCWKKMPGWLKGGVIGAVIVLIYDIIGLFLYGIQDSGVWFFALVLDLITMFIIGAVIGFIIGIIIKKRKKKSISKKRIRRKVRKRK